MVCVSVLSLLDLSAAFDTINQSILIARSLATFGCSGMVLGGVRVLGRASTSAGRGGGGRGVGG